MFRYKFVQLFCRCLAKSSNNAVLPGFLIELLLRHAVELRNSQLENPGRWNSIFIVSNGFR